MDSGSSSFNLCVLGHEWCVQKCVLWLSVCVLFYAFKISSSLNYCHLELLRTASNFSFLVCNKKSYTDIPIYAGCLLRASIESSTSPTSNHFYKQKMPLTGNFVKFRRGKEKMRTTRIVKFDLQGAFSWRPSLGGGVLLFYIAANCWVGHLPTLRRQLHKSCFFFLESRLTADVWPSAVIANKCSRAVYC